MQTTEEVEYFDTNTNEQENNCLQQQDPNVPSNYCMRSWDQILCWPPVPPSSMAVQFCFKEFNGVYYDSSKNATRWCDEMGQWNKTNYKECKELSITDTSGSDIIYSIGYSISLIALFIAVFIFIFYRELRCLRNTIHMNLMCTYILLGFMWILTFTLQVMVQGHVLLCIVSIILLNYATLTNFFWMFVEGLYLYMLVVQTFTIENIKLRIYLLIGWGIPVPIVIVWSIAKGFEPLEIYEDHYTPIAKHCPYIVSSPSDWIYKFPALCVLSINSMFLIKIMWVLITKLRSANTAETQQYRKATKALLVLIPLLGVTYMLTIALPTQGIVATVLQYIRDIMLSTQGFMVSIFYCFLNTEVQNTIRHKAEVWKEARDIKNGRRRFNSTKESPYVGSESVRLFNGQEGTGRAHYLKRESGASDMTTVTFIGCSSSSGRCLSTSGSISGMMTSSVRASILNTPSLNCV